MKKSNAQEARILRVCDYINHHLDKDISLNKLSEVAICSKYHFHRVFKAYVGVSAIKFIQLARMKRASFRLAFEQKFSITEIAYEANFESPEAFSRAFSRLFKQSPSKFRSSPEWQYWHSKFEFNSPKIRDINMDVKIVTFKQRKVAVLEHKGNPKNILESVAKFIAWRKETGLSPVKTSETFGVPYSDPQLTAKEEFRFDICGTTIKEIPANDYHVKSATIPGGECAVVQHKGSHDLISESVYYLYQQWLPTSGRTLRDYPCFFHYLNFIHEVDECELVTDIYLPIIPRK